VVTQATRPSPPPTLPATMVYGTSTTCRQQTAALRANRWSIRSTAQALWSRNPHRSTLKATGIGTIVLDLNNWAMPTTRQRPRCRRPSLSQAAQAITISASQPVPRIQPHPRSPQRWRIGQCGHTRRHVGGTIATLSGTTLTPTGTAFGAVVVTANQLGNTDYSAAAAATVTVTFASKARSQHPPSHRQAARSTGRQQQSPSQPPPQERQSGTPPTAQRREQAPERRPVHYRSRAGDGRSHDSHQRYRGGDWLHEQCRRLLHLRRIRDTAELHARSDSAFVIIGKGQSSGTITVSVTPQNPLNTPVTFACSGSASAASLRQALPQLAPDFDNNSHGIRGSAAAASPTTPPVPGATLAVALCSLGSGSAAACR